MAWNVPIVNWINVVINMVLGLRKKEVILFEINDLKEQLLLFDSLSILLANLEPIFEKYVCIKCIFHFVRITNCFVFVIICHYDSPCLFLNLVLPVMVFHKNLRYV